MSRAELRDMIKKEWKTSYWMEINGFTFFMEDYNISTTSAHIAIYDKITNKLVTMTTFEKINSLIIDYEVIL